MKKRILKKLLSMTLAFVMLLSVVPLGGITGLDFLSLKAGAAGLSVGDGIELGSYPQRRAREMEEKFEYLVVNNVIQPDWTSYGYYSGNGNYGSMVQGDWMQYADFTYEGSKYRAVRIFESKPNTTIAPIGVGSQQYDNGFEANGYSGVYIFEYEPLVWKVLDESGLLLCKTSVDAQPYCATVYGSYGQYTDPQETQYNSDYQTSSIKAWLNDDFYTTAFTANEAAELINTEWGKVFLLPYAFAKASALLYNNPIYSFYTEYALIQGCKPQGEYCYWYIQEGAVMVDGVPSPCLEVWYPFELHSNTFGICPAIQIDLDTFSPDIPEIPEIPDEPIQNTDFTLTKQVWNTDVYGFIDYEVSIPDIDHLDYFGAEFPSGTDAFSGRWNDGAIYDIGDSVPFRLTAGFPYDLEDRFYQGEPYALAFYDQMGVGLTFEPNTLRVVAVNDGVETEIPSSAYTLDTPCTYTNFTASTDDDIECAFRLVINDITTIESITADSYIYVYYNATLNENAGMGDYLRQKNDNRAMLISDYRNTGGKLSGHITEWSRIYLYTTEFVVNKVDENGAPLEGAGFTLYKLIYDEATDSCHWEEFETIAPEAGRTSFEFRGLGIGTYKLVESTVPDGYTAMDDLEFAMLEDVICERSAIISFYAYDLFGVGEPVDEMDLYYALEIFDEELVETEEQNKEGEYTAWVGFNYTAVNASGNGEPIQNTDFTLTKEVFYTQMYGADGVTTIEEVQYCCARTSYEYDIVRGDIGWWDTNTDHCIGDKVMFRLMTHVPDDFEPNTSNSYPIAIYDRLDAGFTIDPTYFYVVAVNDEIETEIPSTAYSVTYSVASDFTGNNDNYAFRLNFDDITSIDGIQENTDIYIYYRAILNENATIGDNSNNGNAFMIANYQNVNGVESGAITESNEVSVKTYKFVLHKVDENGAPLEGAGFSLYRQIYDETTGTADWILVQNIGAENGRTSFEYRGLGSGAYKLVESTTPTGYITSEDYEFVYSGVIAADYQLNKDYFISLLNHEPFDEETLMQSSERFNEEYEVINGEEYFVGLSTTIVNTPSEAPVVSYGEGSEECEDVEYIQYNDEFYMAKIEAPLVRMNNGVPEYFVYWEDSEGNIISNYYWYRFILVRDITVHPVYATQENAVAERDRAKYSSRAVGLMQNADGVNFSLFAEHAVSKPEGSINSHGIIYTTDPDAIDPSILTIDSDNENVVKKPSIRSQNVLTGTLRVAIDRNDADYVWARSYVIDRNNEIHYGDVMQFSFDTPNAPPVNLDDYEIIETMCYDLTEYNIVADEIEIPTEEQPTQPTEQPTEPTEQPSGTSIFDTLSYIWGLILSVLESIFTFIMR